MNPYWTQKGGFMPNCIMESDISNAAKICYMALCSFAGKDKDTCWPSQITLAAKYNSNERSVREHLDELEKARFIKVKQNGLRKSNTYEFLSLEDRDPEAAKNRRSGTAESADQENLGTAKNHRSGTAKNHRSGTAKNRRREESVSLLTEPLSYEPLSYEPLSAASAADTDNLSSPQTLPSEQTSFSPEPNSNPSNTEDPPGVEEKSKSKPLLPRAYTNEKHEDLLMYDLRTHESVDKFITYAYGKRHNHEIGKWVKGKLSNQSNTSLRQKAEKAEAEYGAEAFRLALWKYLDTDKEKLREEKWPLLWFLNDPSIYLPDWFKHSAHGHTAAQNAPEDPAAEKVSSPPSANGFKADSPSAANADPANAWRAKIPANVLIYVDEWNTLIPGLAVKELKSFEVKQAETAIKNSEFREVWPKVLAKCAKISQYRPEDPKTFDWVFLSSKDGPNWQQLYMGKYDWACQPPPGQKLTPGQIALMNAKQRDREKAEREQRTA